MTTTAPDRIELRIPRRAEFVRVARMAACAIAAQLGFTYDLIKDIELAIGEACANAVEHVSHPSSDDILVRFTVEATQLVVEVIDRGQGFEPAQPQQEGLDWALPGGLGLVVIEKVMDDLHVSCDPETGTCVRMIKYRTGG